MAPSDGSKGGSTSGSGDAPVLTVERSDGTVVVALGGELDLYNAGTVRDTLLECCADEPERLVVDLSEVEFVDSTMLGVLVEARSRMTNRRAFLLAGPQLETKRALEVSGLDKHFTIHATRDDALAAAL
jgi:anti-sigma B factor antagonist